MSWFAQAVITGITSFAATNIDDLAILMLFFTQVNEIFRPKHIVIGQYLGFTVLIIASLIGFFGGLVLPKPWIGLLGFLPIAIGVSQLVNREDEQQVQAVSGVEHLKSTASSVSAIASILTPQTYQVTAVTIANGGDNVGIYVPLFASSNLASFAVILSVFYVCIGVWCYVAYRLSRQPAIALILTRYGERIMPFVLIALGIFILIESDTYQLFELFKHSHST